MKYTKCQTCARLISNNNIRKHKLSCVVKIRKTKKEIYAMRCNALKKARSVLHQKPIWNKGLTKEDHPSLNKSVQTREKLSKAAKGRKHSEETKRKIREKALKSSHRRLKKKTIKYVTVNKEVILLDSTWELTFAKCLDKHKIRWTRPPPLKWTDKNNTVHNYFPDFYLIDYNLYVDTKNPFAYETQKEKIYCLQEQYSNIKFITEKKYCENCCLSIQ